MRIRIADSAGCPAPQFVITADNEQDQAILKVFCTLNEYSKDKWKFQFHGATYGQNIESFNFGWIRESPGLAPCEAKEKE